ERSDQAVLNLDVWAKQGGHFHRAGEVEQVERLRLDVRKRLGPEYVHQAADGAGGDVAAVHPAGQREHQRGPVQWGAALDAEQVGGAFIHAEIVRRPTTRGEVGSPVEPGKLDTPGSARFSILTAGRHATYLPLFAGRRPAPGEREEELPS